MNNIYNENNMKNSELIKDLKNLPKIQAPENFEYNLMTRIENRNFEKTEAEKTNFNWAKFFAPSAVVVTVVILFFLLMPQSRQNDNKFASNDKNIESQALVDNSAALKNEILNKSGNENANKSAAGTEKRSLEKPNPNSPQPVGRIPFGYSRSVSLDDYIKGANNQDNLIQGNVVNSGETPSSFDGFFLVEKPDQNTLKKERARIDSLKNAKAKADSLKRLKKLP